MAKTAVARTGSDLEPIDRLEEKVKLLVGMVSKLRADQARAAEEHARLSQEIDTLRARLTEAEDTNAELSVLRDERDVIRTRVAEMLQQLEAI
jgi:regulator of replication initiation timing